MASGSGAPAPEPMNAPPATETASAPLPNFPWPPPLPSEKMNLPRTALGASPSLGAAGRRLVDALNGAGYLEYSFFRAPGGFALVARLEQFQDDGSPGPADRRFLDPHADAPFSLSSYVQHLFFAPDGYYRLIVFVVSDKGFAPTHTAPTAAAAQDWLARGANLLPLAFDRMPLTGGHQLTALIYEFHKHGSNGIATLDPGRLDAHTHLMKSGLYGHLLGGR